MNYKKLTHLILSSILLALVQTSSASTLPNDSDRAIENEVLVHINAYRHKHGLGKLTMNEHMVRVAKQHSLNMAQHRIPFGHTGFMKRIATLRKQIKNAGAGAENVAFNYKNARIVSEQWVLSRGHQRNIMGNYTLTGIGIARDKQGKIYYTQIFMRTGKSTKHRVATRPSFAVPFLRRMNH